MPHTKKFLHDDNIPKMLLGLSVPSMIAGTIEALYNTVDSIFIGHFVGNQALAALSVINSIQFFFIATALFFSVGAASVISRALGSGNDSHAVDVAVHAFWSSLIINIIICFVLLLRLDDFLRAIGSTDEILQYSRDYGSIILWTGFVLPVNNLLLSMLRSRGLVMMSTRLTLLGAVLNIFLDALFIMEFSWGVKGAALATAISQIIVFVAALRKVSQVYHTRFRLHQFRPTVLKDILVIGTPSGLRLLLVAFTMAAAVKNISPYGINALSAFGIVNRILPLTAMLIVSISIGGQPLIGLNYGANSYQRVRNIVLEMTGLAFKISVIITALFLWAPAPLFRLFTNNADVVELCRQIIQIIGVSFCGWAFFTVVAEAFQAMGHAKESYFLLSIYPVFSLVFQAILPKIMGLKGVWYSFSYTNILMGVITLFLFLRELNSLKRKEEALKHAV